MYKTHRLEIEDLYSKTREVADDFKTTKEKVLAMEDNLPKIVREMIAFYIDQRFEKRFDTFLTKDDFKAQISYKMDYEVFKDYQKREIEAKEVDDKEFKIDERFNQLEKSIKGLVNSTQLSSATRKLASMDKLGEVSDVVKNMERKFKENES